MNYSKLTDYAAKDLLLHGDSAKAIKGTEVGAEFDAIATMSATKVDSGGALGTPSSGTLTNCTGLPAAGVTGTALVASAIGTTVQAYDADLTTWAGVTPGTGVATALAVNIGSAGAPVLFDGAGGTPSSLTLTNATGLPASVVTGLTAGKAQQVDQAVTATTRAATTTLGTTLYHTLSDTSTTITAFNGVAGVTYHCTALGAGEITYHATNLIIKQGLASINTAAGDTFDVYMLTATTSEVRNYQLASGQALAFPQAVITSATSQASTSGTSIDFNGIPSWVKRITIMFSGVSTNGTSAHLLQIGDAGGVETSGYNGVGFAESTGSYISITNYTAGFGLDESSVAAQSMYAIATLNLLDAATNLWVFSATGGRSNPVILGGSGSKSLSDVLTTVRVTTVNGTDAFDAGLINILYE